MALIPFSVRRTLLLLKGLLANRDRPDFGYLHSIQDPERFVWEILPHAARTFAPCIAILPEASARAAAVAYLYCRMLDTYEDLSPEPDARDRALTEFAARIMDPGVPPTTPPPPLPETRAVDDRDRAHLLLIARGDLVDAVYGSLPIPVRRLVSDLVRDMAEGMVHYSRAFATQGGVLADDRQVAGYCRSVIGHPVVFVLRMLALARTGDADLPPDLVEDAMRVSEFVQLANVTRDIEKDLKRGVAYRPDLRDELRRPAGPRREARVRAARKALLRLALARVPSYRRMLAGMALPPVSLARASALLMLLYTHRYYGRCASRVGLRRWSGGTSSLGLILTTFPAVFSRAYTERCLARAEGDFARAAARLRNDSGKPAEAPTVGLFPPPGRPS